LAQAKRDAAVLGVDAQDFSVDALALANDVAWMKEGAFC
jgi:hypothetical protein